MVNSFGSLIPSRASDTVSWIDVLPTEVKVGIIYGARAYSDPEILLKFAQVEITRYPYGYGEIMQMLRPFKSMWEPEADDPDEYVKFEHIRLDTEPISNIAITDETADRASSWTFVNHTSFEVVRPYHLTFYSFANHYDVELPRVEKSADLCALRLALYFYLMMNEHCAQHFNLCDTALIWPFDSYNLQSVLRIFEEDLTKYNEDYILKQYLEKMGRYGIDFDEFHDACLKGGFMDTLMKSMQILGKEEGQKQEQKFRL